MERLIKILEDIHPDIDYEACDDLIDGHRLDSLSIMSLVAALEDEYDITIPAAEIIPDNFNSINAMLALIQRLQEE